MCAHMAFIARRFEEMTGVVILASAVSICLMIVSSWHTTGRAACQRSVRSSISSCMQNR